MARVRAEPRALVKPGKFGRDAYIHDDSGFRTVSCLSFEPADGVGEGARLEDVARCAAPGEAGSRQGQGCQLTVVALLLRTAEPGGNRTACEVSVGQVEERNSAGERSRSRANSAFSISSRCFHSGIEFVQAVAALRTELFESRAAVLQPVQGFALA